MKKILKVLFVMVLGFSLFSCGNAADMGYNENQGGLENGDQSGSSNNVVVDNNRKIIYEVSYSITGEDVMDSKNEINNKVNEIKGYTESSNESNNQAVVVYKIPTEQLNLFLDYIDKFDGIGSKQINSYDVTSSYSYIEARISILQASREAYVKLLENEYLSRNEIIQLNDKIADIDTELLKINNEKNSYDNRLTYSKVTINYYVNEQVKKPSFFKEYGQYLVNFFAGLGKIILYVLPVAITFGGIFCAIFFPIYFKNKKRK